MLLLKEGRPVVADRWQEVADEAPLPAAGPVIVSLARWRAERAALIAGNRPLGVRLASHELAGEIADDLAHLQLIALEFPSFRDGRAYSTARLLRERYRFSGEIRAVGNVLRDQFLFMHRCGIDAFAVEKEADAEAWQAAMEEISVLYQSAADARPAASRLRHLRSAAE